MLDHSEKCQIRASGGCPDCKKFWFLLQLHARQCRHMPPEACPVPRCRDLKEHYRRARYMEQLKQQRMDERRRNFAMSEMMSARDASGRPVVPPVPGAPGALPGMPAMPPQMMEMMKRAASDGTLPGMPPLVRSFIVYVACCSGFQRPRSHSLSLCAGHATVPARNHR